MHHSSTCTTCTLNRYIIPRTRVGYELLGSGLGAVVTKLPPKDERVGNRVTARARHCLPLFFPKVVILADELWDIYSAFIPGITILGITFLVPRLNNSILSPC